MSAIASTSNDNPYAAFGLAGNADKARSNGMGQADFLRLMTEQMKNQDPLKPLEGQQFLAQLAQFSTVQGIEQMNSAMGAMASVMESDQTLRAAALVGREALVDANAFQYSGEGSVFTKPTTRWPDFDPTTPPRPAVIAIVKEGGGEIGS